MKAILDTIKAEPVRTHAAIIALLNLGMAFGLDLTDEQMAAVNVAVVAVLAVVLRRSVTPA